MIKLASFCAAAALILLPGAALSAAQEAVKPKEAKPKVEYSKHGGLHGLDADEDGYITKGEWSRFFSEHDRNEDGLLSGDEFQLGEFPDQREAARENAQRIKAFEKLDRNADKFLSRTEWPGTDADFQLIDADRDGSIAQTEFLSLAATFWNLPFESLDFDRDGIITRKEWLDSERAFTRLDRDGNGVIDKLEFYRRS